MTTNQPSNEADLGAFLEQVGRSLSEAQESLGTGLDLPTSFVVANAELEVKAALTVDEAGRTVVQTLSAQEIREGGIDPGVLSTVRIGFAATARDLVQAPAPSSKPKRRAQDVVNGMRSRPDIVALEKILGNLSIETTYVPDRERWLVVARDREGRLVREAILSDEAEEDAVG